MGYWSLTVVQYPEPQLVNHDNTTLHSILFLVQRAPIHHLILVPLASIIQSHKIVLVQCASNVQWWIGLHIVP